MRPTPHSSCVYEFPIKITTENIHIAKLRSPYSERHIIFEYQFLHFRAVENEKNNQCVRRIVIFHLANVWFSLKMTIIRKEMDRDIGIVISSEVERLGRKLMIWLRHYQHFKASFKNFKMRKLYENFQLLIL